MNWVKVWIFWIGLLILGGWCVIGLYISDHFYFHPIAGVAIIMAPILLITTIVVGIQK